MVIPSIRPSRREVITGLFGLVLVSAMVMLRGRGESPASGTVASVDTNAARAGTYVYEDTRSLDPSGAAPAFVHVGSDGGD
jgi:hypothetical protein